MKGTQLFPTYYRYSIGSPQLPKALSADKAVAHLRESLFYHAHNHAFWRARAKALEAHLVALEAPGSNRK